MMVAQEEDEMEEGEEIEPSHDADSVAGRLL